MGDALDTISLTKAMYGWTKYGGSRHGLIKHTGKWFCQACKSENPDSLPAYMFNADNGALREFIRLCSICENIVKTENIKEMDKLFKRTRKNRD